MVEKAGDNFVQQTENYKTERKNGRFTIEHDATM